MSSCFEVYLDHNGEYGFRLKALSGQILLNGVAHFGNKADTFDAIRQVQHCVESRADFVVQVAPRGSYYFELNEPSTGQLLAKCGTFESKDEACESINQVRKMAGEAKIVELAH